MPGDDDDDDDDGWMDGCMDACIKFAPYPLEGKDMAQ